MINVTAYPDLRVGVMRQYIVSYVADTFDHQS